VIHLDVAKFEGKRAQVSERDGEEREERRVGKETNILDPLMTQSSPLLVAVVLRAKASDPEEGSERAKHPSLIQIETKEREERELEVARDRRAK